MKKKSFIEYVNKMDRLQQEIADVNDEGSGEDKEVVKKIKDAASNAARTNPQNIKKVIKDTASDAIRNAKDSLSIATAAKVIEKVDGKDKPKMMKKK